CAAFSRSVRWRWPPRAATSGRIPSPRPPCPRAPRPA
ncbi:MAG: hypothetical protein AVDCRST_MAG13-3767, partial [uncultured Solirubrobacteraceae bacterium]